ncbi:MAG: hypothetical protein DI609_07700 [Corynebacterium urealyticum]|uniref:Helix-turn-helix domain-containing protein n=1 Tax=Corynebacterium urealyticum TaxID=43771 RepID=A0A2W5CXV2_9CORY|nr:MAG: hypothetical protein DI609_07700 [Corynebacterium urealyticum]
MKQEDDATPLTALQVAKKFGVTPVTIQRWVRAGRLPATKLPGRNGAYLFDGETIRKMADRAGRENTTDQAPQTEPPK